MARFGDLVEVRVTPKALLPFISVVFLISRVEAHCPLCTAGVAAAAGGAALMGVKTSIVGLFVGAFAASTGFWIANKNSYTSLRSKLLLATASFLVTVLPVMPAAPGVIPVYISIAGDYGSPLNRTYLVNSFLSGSLIGAAIVAIAPWLSGKLTELRGGSRIPFQGVAVTLSSLLVAAIFMQLWVWEVRM